LDHADDNGSEFALDTEETFQISSCSFDASAFIGRVGLEIVAVGRIET
jgi:hypothetical protein